MTFELTFRLEISHSCDPVQHWPFVIRCLCESTSSFWWNSDKFNVD